MLEAILKFNHVCVLFVYGEENYCGSVSLALHKVKHAICIMQEARYQMPIFNQGVCPYLLHHMHPHHHQAVLKGSRYITQILNVDQCHGKHEICNVFPRCLLKSADWSRGRFARRKRRRFVLNATLATLGDRPTKTDLCICHLICVLSAVPMYLSFDKDEDL